MMEIRSIPKVTAVLIVINVLLFLLENILGAGSEDAETALRFGALFVPYVKMRGEYYRLFTAMFLHFGPEHLGSNMLSLYIMGAYVEKAMGKARYLVIYLFSGLCGNILVYFQEMLTQDYALSAGASGAICGLLGVFFLFAVVPGLKRVFPLKRVLLAVALTLAPGLGDGSINMTAHVGGLIGGFIATALFYVAARIRLHKNI